MPERTAGLPAIGARRFPLLYQVNARTLVHGLGPDATLDAIDDDVLDRLLPPGLDWLYLLGVWQTGPAGAAVSRRTPDVRAEAEATLDDLTEDDLCGSCFSIRGYRVHERLGGDGALAGVRARLARRGVALMLDFVPNHTAPDHPWVTEHPDRYIQGTVADLEAEPGNWCTVPTGSGERVLAYGRDPYFPGWSDTLQLDYSSPAVQAAMREELLAAAAHGDGLRCDMAMLLLPDVFERTWGRAAEPFWPEATATVRAWHPGFTFLAEVYWGREYDLQQQGFDATYDKALYDRLVAGDAGAVRGHLHADAAYQARSARFLENHDEPRAATVFGTGDRHRAAAVTAFLSPGLRFFQHGQFEGWRRHVPMHLCRAPVEEDDDVLATFYTDLLEVLADPVVHDGRWQLLDTRPAWDGNDTHTDLVAFTWSDTPPPPAAGGPGADGTGGEADRDAEGDGDGLRYVIAVNLADHWSQCYVPLADPALPGRLVTLDDRVGPNRYERHGDTLSDPGLYLDVPPWAHHVFAVT